MTTGLWGATCGVPVSSLADRVPPACRRPVAVLASPPPVAAGDGLLEAPAWPVAGATHFVPSFAALTEIPYSSRLELSVRVGGSWSPWAAGAALGPMPFAAPAPVEALDVDVDVFRAHAPVEAARLRVRLPAAEAAAVLASPWMLTLSAADTAPSVSARGGPAAPGVEITVPALSQMAAEAALASRVCLPTCVAMILDFWRRPVALGPLASEMFHAGLDLYGVWPAAITAAGRRGLAGYLLRFPDWGAAAWCLEQGLPVIASIRYAAGELAGAAAIQTPGHLVVLTGWDGGEALVNDPAAADAASVPRRYRIEELERVWLERAGVGFVIFPPATPLRGA